jgi:hypothetical protein
MATLGMAIIFFITNIPSHISDFLSCHFYSFCTQILQFHAFLPSSAGVPCLKVAFLLLLGSLLLPTSLLLLGCMAHGH